MTMPKKLEARLTELHLKFANRMYAECLDEGRLSQYELEMYRAQIPQLGKVAYSAGFTACYAEMEPVLAFLREVAKPPYKDSNIASLAETLRCRAAQLLADIGIEGEGG